MNAKSVYVERSAIVTIWHLFFQIQHLMCILQSSPHKTRQYWYHIDLLINRQFTAAIPPYCYQSYHNGAENKEHATPDSPYQQNGRH